MTLCSGVHVNELRREERGGEEGSGRGEGGWLGGYKSGGVYKGGLISHSTHFRVLTTTVDLSAPNIEFLF